MSGILPDIANSIEESLGTNTLKPVFHSKVWLETRSVSQRKVLITFNQDGTASLDTQGDVVFDIIQSHAHGLWKKIDARTFISSFLVLEYDHDANLYATVKLQARYTLSPSGDRYTALGFFTETLTNGQVNTGGPLGKKIWLG